MDEKIRNRGGAPRGNQNARKHGLYSKVLTPEEQAALPEAGALNGLDREIAIVRIKIGGILANDPHNAGALRLSTLLLARLMRVRKLLETRVKAKESSAASAAVRRYLARLFPENNPSLD
jgi:hypothetical protein